MATVSASACHPDHQRAALAALRELVASLSLADLYRRERRRAARMLEGSSPIRDPHDHALVAGLPEALERFECFLRTDEPPRSLRDRNRAGPWTADDLLSVVARSRFDVLIADVTAADVRSIGWRVCRVLVPGTIPLTFGGLNVRLDGLPYQLPGPAEVLPHPFA